MIKVFKFLLAFGIAFSVTGNPVLGFAKDETSKEEAKQEKEDICKVAKATSKDKSAAQEDRDAAKIVHKKCKKDKKIKNRKNCVGTSSRISRCL